MQTGKLCGILYHLVSVTRKPLKKSPISEELFCTYCQSYCLYSLSTGTHLALCVCSEEYQSTICNTHQCMYGNIRLVGRCGRGS